MITAPIPNVADMPRAEDIAEVRVPTVDTGPTASPGIELADMKSFFK